METELITNSGSVFQNIQFYPLTFGIGAGIVVIICLLVCSGFISGSEVAFFLLTPAEKLKLSQKKSRINHLVLKNLEFPEKLVATILVAKTFINIGIVVTTSFITGKLTSFQNSHVSGFIFQVILITFLILIFGEVFPRVFASRRSLAFARFMAIPLSILEKICRPVNQIFIYSTSLVNKRLQKHTKNITVDELSHALDLSSDKELSNEKNILEGIVKFGNKNVSEIMRPRVDVIAVDIRSTLSDLLKTINDSGYSRIPVYSGSFDQVHGILYIKDLLPHVHKGNSFKWQALIRPPFYVPETKKINTLLEEFQKRKVHLAVVVDEYGGSSGIVTLEDVLEEIVGEITDESDEIESYFTKIDENVYLFDGKVSINEFCKITCTDEQFFDEVKGDAESIAGLILELRGEIPELHEKINFKSFQFIIEAVNKRRIEKIKVELIKTESET